ncbi:MAG: hypothetical protein AABY15_02575 [Nanoarchaeota archaeon]
MRNKEEINEAITRIKAEKPHVPKFNAFGENNHELIDATIDTLESGFNYKTNIEEIAEERGWDENVVSHIQEAINFNEGYNSVDELLWYPETDYREQTKSVKLCSSKTCSDCPFSKTSVRGFLADYTIQDFKDFMNAEASFPCHKSMEEDGKSLDEVTQDIEDGKKPFCRGYVESMIKSAKRPYKNKKLIEAIELVKSQGLSENTMSIFEFIDFHDKSKIKESLKH